MKDVIKVEQLVKSYGELFAVKNLSLTVPVGSIFGLLGANGAGKSTLLKIASGALKPSQGEILLDSISISKISPREIAKRRAVLEQESALNFDYTVLDTVLLGRYAYNIFPQNSPLDFEIAKDCLAKVGLKDFANRLYTRLSGGEKRRVQLARALCQIGDNSLGKVLFLDEPSAGLDPAHAHAAMSAAKWVSDNNGIVISVLHDANLAACYATKIALIKDGKILASGDCNSMLNADLLTHTYSAKCRIITSQNNERVIYFPV